MKRKVIKQGHNTYTITLPSSWAKKFKIIAGNEVDVVEKNNSLILNAEKHDETSRTEFDLDGLDVPAIWKYLMGAYRAGYDEIKITFEPNKEFDHPYKFATQHFHDDRFGRDRVKVTVLEALHSFSTRFVGMEIVEHGANFILIKDMGDATSKEFENSLRRVFLIIKQMNDETMDAMRTGKVELLQHIHDVDITLDKFHDYCVRVLNKTECRTDSSYKTIASTLYLLEMLGDEFKNIALHMIRDFKDSKLSALIPFTEHVKKLIDAYYDLFYKFDNEKVKMLSKLDSTAYQLYPSFYKKATEEEKEVFHHLRMISKYVNALLELRIAMEFEK